MPVIYGAGDQSSKDPGGYVNSDNPLQADVPARIGQAWDASSGVLPTRVVLHLAQSNLAGHELDRASRMLARQFDLDPSWLLPQTGVGSADPTLRQYTDPVTGGALSFAAAQRFLQPYEPKVIRQMLGEAVRGTPGTGTAVEVNGHKVDRISRNIPGVSRERVAEVVKTLVPIDGTHTPFSQVLAAAVDVASNPNIDLKVFAQNLQVTASATALSPLLQIAAAQRAAENGKVIHSMADVASAVLPQAAAAFQAGDTLSQLEQQQAAQRQGIAERSRRDPGAQPMTSTEGQLINAGADPAALGLVEGASVAAAGLVGPKDWFSFLTDTTDNYVTAAKSLEGGGIKIPFTNTRLGHDVGHLFAGLGHALDAVYYPLVGVPLAQGVHLAFTGHWTPGFDFHQALKDESQIIMARTTATAALQAQGVPPWFTAVGELAAGFYLDPTQVALNKWSDFKAAHLLSGLAEDGKAADWMGHVDAFINAPVRRIGDLHDTTVAQYLIREASRTKDADRFFGRAVDNFRTYFSADGLNKIVADHVWQFVKDTKKLGLSEDAQLEGVKGVLMAGFGIRPDNLGDVASEIETIARTKMAESTDRIFAANAARAQDPLTAYDSALRGDTLGAGLPPEANQALSMLSDTQMDVLSQNYRMLEIPHTAGPLGRMAAFMRTTDQGADLPSQAERVIRSVLQTNPEQMGGRLIVNIENPTLAVKDFERGLVRSQRFTSQEIEAKKLEFAQAIDLGNPNREFDFARIVGRDNELILRRSDATYGVGQEMHDLVIRRLNDHMGFAPMQESFGATLASDTSRATVRAAQTRVRAIDAELGINAGEGVDAVAARAALHAERDQLTTRVDQIAKTGSQTEIKSPFMVSTLRNSAEMIDPVLYRQGIAEVMGTFKKWERAFRGHFPDAPLGLGQLKDASAVHVPLRAFMDRAAEAAIQDVFMAIWKPLAVLRPAYILRVVGLEEQSRFFATSGLARRAYAGGATGPLLERLGLAKDRYIPLGVKLAEQPGQRGQSIEDALLYLHDHGANASVIEAGFNPADKALGDTLAQRILDGGSLSRDERIKALEMVRRQQGQLDAVGIDTKNLHLRAISGNAEKAATKARDYQAHIDSGDLRLMVPGARGGEPLANNNVSRIALASMDAQSKELKALNPNRIGVVTRGEPHFYDFYYNALAHQFGQDPGLGARYLLGAAHGDSEDKMVADTMAWLGTNEGKRYAQRLMGTSDYNPEDLAGQVRMGAKYVTDLVGIHPEVAQAAYDGSLTIDALKSINKDELPLFVHGPIMDSTLLAKQNIIQSARDAMGKYILQAPTNALSRQPYFKSWYDRMYGALVEEGHARLGDKLTEVDLAAYRETARKFAIDRVNRIMFDFSRSGRLEELTKFFTVFLQPYLEFPTVWSRIIRENPAMLGHAIRLGRAGLQSGFLKHDPQTGELVVPLSWWAGAAPLLHMLNLGGSPLPGGGSAAGWSLSAPLTAFNLFSNATFQLPTGGFAGDVPLPLPSLAPPFQFAMQKLFDHTNMDAGFKSRISSWLFQYGDLGSAGFPGLMPAWLRHTIEAYPGHSGQVDFNATHFLQLQQAMGLTPSESLAMKQSHEFSAFRAFFGLVFPAAPKISFPTQQLEDQLRTLRDSTTGLGYQAGTQEFMRLHPDLNLLTIARTMWDKENPDNPSPVSIPANKLVNQLLNTRGGKQFAKDHPRWVWAIIPQELRSGAFDPGTFFGQIAAGQIKVKTPSAFLQSADIQAGWDAYFAARTSYTAAQEALTTQGIKQGEIPWTKATDVYNAALADAAQLHPAWAHSSGAAFSSYNPGWVDNVDPNSMAEARQLGADPIFTTTDVGQGLVAYLKLFDSTKLALHDANLSTLNSTSADRLGISGTYNDGVAAIEKAHPEFSTAMSLFFSQALQGQVKGRGDQMVDGLPSTFVDTVVTPWQANYDKLKIGPDIATNDAERNAAYEAIRSFVNASYEKFSDTQNPMLIKWAGMNPTERADYLSGLVGRSYVFASRFDKQTVLGQPDNAPTEALWSEYGQLRDAISAQEAAKGNAFNAGAAYGALDTWVLQQVGANPTFSAQVQASNTWGYEFSKVRTQLFPVPAGTTDQAAPYWTAFLAGVQQIQQVATSGGLVGLNDPNTKKRAAYVALRQTLQDYALKLGEASAAFQAQWDYLEKQSGSNAAVSWFIPDANYPLGGDVFALAQGAAS